MTTTTVSLESASPPRSSAVTGLAWGFIAFSALTVALLTLPLLPGDALVASLGVEAGSGGLTGGVAWLIERSNAFTSLLMVGAAVTLTLSVALLLRRRWARPAFLGLMAAGFVGVLGGAALTPLTFGFMADAAGEMASSEDSVAGLIGALSVLIMVATVLVVLFAWAGWKLTTPAVRAEFERTPVAAEG